MAKEISDTTADMRRIARMLLLPEQIDPWQRDLVAKLAEFEKRVARSDFNAACYYVTWLLRETAAPQQRGPSNG